MSRIYYPTREILEFWTENLQSGDPVLTLALPAINAEWHDRVMEIIERASTPYAKNDLHYRAAYIFYLIDKSHNYIDGNKRSSILVVYLFYLVNNHYLPSTYDIRRLAKSIAASKGREKQDKWIRKAECDFKRNVKILPPLTTAT